MAGQLAGMRQELVAEVLSNPSNHHHKFRPSLLHPQLQVICATCAAVGSDVLAGATFPLVVLDEASQAAEPEALIPLTRAAQHAVLVGDHLQLPPVCNSEVAAAAGLAVSHFERLMAAGVPSAMLQVPYRMHPALSAFPNAAFYSNQLTDGITASQRPSPRPFPWPQAELPLLFVDVAEGQEEAAAGGSKLNRPEADMVQQVLVHLLTVCGERRSSLRVVTPYLAQLNLLSQQLAGLAAAAAASTVQSSALAGGSSSSSSHLHYQQQQADGAVAAAPTGASLPAAAADVLEIKTVDGYQGREKELVLFSAVRANAQAQRCAAQSAAASSSSSSRSSSSSSSSQLCGSG
uniref:DNA2/NAM7 helicase-like C-terminal domain-containing protein n=1 Tax=Tetradesmus obliquus TaxID=3088 RepID=A0A383VJF3_TETOB